MTRTPSIRRPRTAHTRLVSAPTVNAPDSRPRTLHLLDVENLVGPQACAGEVLAFWNAYRRFAVGLGASDHIVVASGPRFAAVALFAIPPSEVQRRVRRGIDGADRALLDAVDIEHDSRRFERLVIGSGDHAFTPLARSAREHGMSVHLFIGRGTPAHTLLEACPTRTWLRVDGGPAIEAQRRQLRMTLQAA